ncbi:hypothetical protein [Pseudooceanicola atlanticus]|uniref:hypothetical protein n=1 Tax=Pseudooceanicola atlanticus TaxID=1461694 RepID=UPI002353C027|nr:hypothetical protein [Pseudooceanicola atlanticus]
MKLELDFLDLVRLRNRMGAEKSPWTPGATQLDPREEIKAQLQSGIEITLDDVDRGPGGLLTYKGEQVILYIKDTRSDRYTLEHEPEKSRRFHVADCETLESMRHNGRFERYVVTNRMDGLFLVDWLDKDTRERGETEAALKVCKNCLKAINWRGYEHAEDRLELDGGRRQSKSEIWSGFEISHFLLEFSTFFHNRPSRRDTTAEPNIYVENWAAISERTRRSKNWTCEQCGVNLRSAPHLLHCHHKSGVVTDNSAKNLEVLCAVDHAKQPDHGHMRVPLKDKNKITELRLEQGLPAS